MVHVNLSDVSSEFEVLPAGVYGATLLGAEVVERDDPDKHPYISWEFKLDDHPGKAWTNTSLSPNALWKLKEVLVAMGEEEEIINDSEGFDLDPTDYIGAEVSLVLIVGAYRGKERNEVESVLPPQEEAPRARVKTSGGSKAKRGGRRKVV